MSEHKHGLPYYKKMLELMGALSSLFSNSSVPFIDPRIAEKLFCRAFKANDVSRSDVSVDATINDVGIGIKTFIDKSGKKFEKIAEFNRDSALFRKLSPLEMIKKIAELRNARLETTKRIYGLQRMIYHCVTRRENEILVYDCSMDPITISRIKNVKVSDNGNVITFDDEKNKYSFSTSKSTLYKQFSPEKNILKLHINIIKDPFEVLESKFADLSSINFREPEKHPFVVLPLYSISGQIKVVHSKSGLNQWNAGGRRRDPNEVYIQIPAWIRQHFPKFFPPRDQPFDLVLPDGNILNAKVCQDDSKALMSNPNLALGKWLLREVLNLSEGELLTYDKLQEIGLDSVFVEKINKNLFRIDFKKIGTYEEFTKANQ
jgi:hypothetical protein